MNILLIDDERDPKGVDPRITRVAKTVPAGAEALKEMTWDVVYLDYSFNGDTKITGSNICHFLSRHREYLPKTIVLVSGLISYRFEQWKILKDLPVEVITDWNEFSPIEFK